MCSVSIPICRTTAEYFQDPAAWFQKRTAFARSVAASSMAGYVIGLGDRHSSNILLDRRTAEVVHIDLGIAFEQVEGHDQITPAERWLLFFSPPPFHQPSRHRSC